MEEVWRDFASTQQVAHGGVQTAADDEQVGLILRQEREDQFIERSRIFRIPHPSIGPTQVQIETLRFSSSDLVGRSRVGVESLFLVETVNVNTKDVFVVDRGLRCALI